MEQPTQNASPWTAPAAELLQSHCAQVAAYAAPLAEADESPAVATKATAPSRLTRTELPPVMVALIDRYEASHPGTTLEPLRYLTIGYPAGSDAGAGDALQGDVVSLSVTETVVDAAHIQVTSRILIARRAAHGGSHRG